VDIVVVGGFGRVGLPLALAFADRGKRVAALDVNREAFELLREGRMPFLEAGAGEVLPRVLASEKLVLTLEPGVLSQAAVVIVATGTPVDRHLNPELSAIRAVLEQYLPHLRDGQLLVFRSTVYPGVSEWAQRWLLEQDKRIDVAFCPERIVEGHALEELATLPQIIAAFSDDGLRRARELFELLTPEVLVLKPLEAELAKLFTNVWRYVKFATANQFFMIANDLGADFHAIHAAMTTGYERARDLPSAGFAAGPCLFKDAMQLGMFNAHSFSLGNAAMLVNEGLPNYVVAALARKHRLRELTVGILGMAYKANIDDRRESLAYKLKKLFELECPRVLCSDVYLNEPGFVSAEELVREADVIVLCAPHREYRELAIPQGKIVVDVWSFWGRGCLL
jgi:UDP-N-acetyl-D-mannosaminuronic acid dehydrogenase